MNALMSPKAQLVLAWVLLVGSLIGWPATALTIFSEEPQGVLGLSWFAIILGAWNTIVTTAVNREVTPDGGGYERDADADADAS
jgi:hypothetical protein